MTWLSAASEHQLAAQSPASPTGPRVAALQLQLLVALTQMQELRHSLAVARTRSQWHGTQQPAWQMYGAHRQAFQGKVIHLAVMVSCFSANQLFNSILYSNSCMPSAQAVRFK